jgi:trk system potassium uptake protein TrkH
MVIDTATGFTRRGQTFLLLLIQLGGLGMITFTTLIIVSLGRKLSFRTEALAASAAEVVPHLDYRHLTKSIVRFTLAIEAAGAALLFLAWLPRYGPAEALWHAVFQAVSAFCNAGFSTFGDSLVQAARAPAVLLPVMTLIVVGGIGFLVMEEVYLAHQARRAGRAFRFSLHSRIVLVTTAGLLAGGWLLYTASEWRGVLHGLPVWARLLNGLFMSVTARTAGFHTVDYAAADDGTNFVTILLMSIGGSPGSTAGGLKVTTFALIGLVAWSRLRGETVVSAGARSVPSETVSRAVGLFVVAFGTVTTAILLLAYTEPGMAAGGAGRRFLAYMFEAVSAFNTVGLSLGATGDLSTAGRLIAIGLMFVGRVGPLTFASAIALQRPRTGRGFRYAHENVAIG